MDLEKSIIGYLKEVHDRTGGNCGVQIVEIKLKLGISSEKIKTCLRELYKKDLIFVREGIHGKLIFKNGKND